MEAEDGKENNILG